MCFHGEVNFASSLHLSFSRIGVLIGVLCFSWAVSGCGHNSDPQESAAFADTSCKPGQAQILVGDTYLRSLCGCGPTLGGAADGTWIYPPSVLTCAVSPQTTVLFHFETATLKHQLVPSSDSSQFPSTPVMDPTVVIAKVGSFPIRFDSVGSYGFKDAFNPLLLGTFLVH